MDEILRIAEVATAAVALLLTPPEIAACLICATRVAIAARDFLRVPSMAAGEAQ